MAYKTFQQLYTDTLTQIDESSGSGSAIAKTIVKAGINEAYAEVASLRDWDNLRNNAAITTASGTWEYTPVTASSSVCRLRRIISVLDETNNRFLTEVQREEFEKTYPSVSTSSTTYQGSPQLWFISTETAARDLQIRVYQVPNAVMTLRVWFYEEPLELSADTDVPRIPDQFHYGLTYLGAAKYFEYQRDMMSMYYRDMHEAFKAKILTNEYNPTDEMPQIQPLGRGQTFIKGKLGRIYN